MRRSAAAIAALLILSSCVSAPRREPIKPPLLPPDARAAGIAPGPEIAMLGLDDAAATRALVAFRSSCPALLRRTDRSRLTTSADWFPVCTRLSDWPNENAVEFFKTYFETVRVGSGAAFATGYYEPEIAASRTPVASGMPVYAVPADLVEQPATQCPSDWPAGTTPAVPPCRKVTKRGRMIDGQFGAYFDRGEIEDGALAGKGLEIAYATDAIDFFFLQVQGSGRLRFPDGSVMRIGYAGQNGRDYTGIGKLMKERGLLQPGKATMQDIVAWLRANPEQGRAIMRENKSWVFFKELTGAGPLGALNVPVVARASVAADPAFVPLGAPVFLTMDRNEASGLWIAQDTGGAIKGANRFDTFWGAGTDAAAIAGGMASHGTALLLLPKGTLARLRAENAAPHP